jgi:Zn-dependent protease with chaperone function
MEQAVEIERSPENLISLAESLLMGIRGGGTPAIMQQRALDLAKEAAAAHPAHDDPEYEGVVAQAALALHKQDEFRTAVGHLMHTYPRDPRSHYFDAIRSAVEGDWIGAEREIKQAESLGLSHEIAQRFLESGVHRRALVQRVTRLSFGVILAWIGGLLALLAAGRYLSSRTLRTIEAADSEEPTAHELQLRGVYRTLIRISGAYYYLSLPFVVVSVLAIAAGIVYLFLLLGRLPIGFLLTIVIGALVTVYKMVQSIFVRLPREDPGRTLREDEAPGLWAVVRTVADTVGTRPVDEIRLTPGTEMAVYERGTARDRSDDRGNRVLVLGTGLLNGFSQGPFCAVLAHEYGHFSHRDTAGGDIALRVRQDMMKFAVAMVQNRQAVWWNVAFQFLRLYSFLFRRISHGATRLQEVLADRLAARHYGSDHFETGLRHVIARHVEFTFALKTAIQQAVEARRTLQNIYVLPAAHSPEIDAAIAGAIDRPTTEDDTHPGALDRFRLVAGIHGARATPVGGPVWDLFTAPESVMNEMTEVISRHVRVAVVDASAVPA